MLTLSDKTRTSKWPFKAFFIFEKQEGNKRHIKMDENKFTSTVHCCHLDTNIFGELLGHFEIYNDHF